MAKFTFVFVMCLLVIGGIAQDTDAINNDDGNSTTTTDTNTTTTNTTTTTESTTTTEDTNTTTTEETTTTTTEETTTTPETTTTETTTTTAETTTSSTTSTTPSSKTSIYKVTEGNLTCIMVDFQKFEFDVEYNTNATVTNTSKIAVPLPSSGNGTATGSCSNADGTQEMTITWGPDAEQSNVKFVFNTTKDDNKTWTISELTAALFISNASFPGSTNLNKTLMLDIHLLNTAITVPTKGCFKCFNTIYTKNITATIDSAAYNMTTTANVDGSAIEAFNPVENEPDFGIAVHCPGDSTSDIVPIAVGCALAGLVIIVLIAYLVGRRRRTAAYQSV